MVRWETEAGPETGETLASFTLWTGVSKRLAWPDGHFRRWVAGPEWKAKRLFIRCIVIDVHHWPERCSPGAEVFLDFALHVCQVPWTEPDLVDVD